MKICQNNNNKKKVNHDGLILFQWWAQWFYEICYISRIEVVHIDKLKLYVGKLPD